MTYIKEFLVLFVLMTLLLYLVPGERLKKYIRFFTEMVLLAGILSPLLSFLFDYEEFLAQIEYETFTENLTQIERDMERMEFLQNDYYLEEYEIAIGEDVRQTAEPIAESYGYQVGSVKVKLTEDYSIEGMTLSLSEQKRGEIVIEEIAWKEQSAADLLMNGENGVAAEIRRKLAEQYGIEETYITVQP